MAISSFLLSMQIRYAAAPSPASYLLWSFEESKIALLSHYVHASIYLRAELRSRADAGGRSGWIGLCVVQQHRPREATKSAHLHHTTSTRRHFQQP